MPDVAVGGFATAYNAATTGTTLELLAGTHVTSGRQTIAKKLIIKSKEWDPVTWPGKLVTDGFGHLQDDLATKWQGTWGFTTGANECVIRGIAFDGRSGSSGPGSFDINADSLVFEDCRFTDGYRWILVHIGSTRKVSSVTFRRCRFRGYGSRAAHDHAIYFKTAINCIVEDCIFYEGNGWAFHCYTDCDNLIVRRSVVDRCNGGVTFSGDTANTGVSGNDGYSTGNVIEDSQFTNNMGGGSQAWGPAEKGLQTLMLAQFWYGSPQSGVNTLRRSNFWVGPSTPPQGGRIQSGSPIVVEGTVINVNPLYTNNLAGNFKLQSGSPALNMGPSYIQPGSAPPPPPPPPPVNSPNPVTALNANAGNAQVSLSWTNPASGTTINGVIVRRSTTGFPTSVTDGAQALLDSTSPFDTSLVDTGLVNDVTYYYTVFTRAADGTNSLYSTGVSASARPTAPPVVPTAPERVPRAGTPRGSNERGTRERV